MADELLIEKIKAAYSEHADVVLKAYDFAKRAHEGQKRSSGEDYFIHPCAVVEILTDFGFDATTATAAFLHDVLEDTSVTPAVIEAEFSREILDIVEGVTKLDKLKFLNREDAQAENFRKMFFAMAKDMRVIIIRFADRLHNMRSLGYQPVDKQMYTAQETLDIYAPLAGRMGMSFFKCELEDLAMQYIYPKEFKHISNYVASKGEERQQFLDVICEEIQMKLDELGIKGEVNGRPKHFYSIFKKMRELGIEIDQIYDLLAVRIIVNDVKECYTLLGEVHNMWKPIPGRMKDYIAMPKANNYQSLHTTVMTQFNETFEVQIRTFEMHKIAEFGIAAHWKYKEGKHKETTLDSKVRWLREVMEAEKDVDNAKEFMAAVKISVFDDEVFVFTPKGDVYDLPVGSTPIDLAYKIHSAVGNKCVGAKINKRIVPLNSKLVTGDIVEILTSNSAKGPSRDWLSYAHTASTRSKIRSYFKKEMKDENIKRGKDMLEREAKRRGYNLSDLISSSDAVDNIMLRHSLTSLEDLYAAIGYGGLSTNQILFKLIELFKNRALTDDSALAELKQAEQTAEQKPHSEKSKRAKSGVLIRGFSDFSVRLAHCCSPVPGDEIVGYVSRGRGVSVHRVDCTNVKGMEAERMIEAKWDRLVSESYSANVKIYGENRNGMLAEITTIIANMKIQIMGANVKVDKATSTVLIEVSIEIKSAEQLDDIVKRLRNLEGVIEIRR
ncbi:MAG TPA: bifunctional (p)ppGpp synthetase/guanosine-3',5'-bis(diphosphate) 3'-pyrophosphohydrolase [Clostridia bacterium]|nr:bifunctional (p)ppGpp synthetase/guanosine-3',5'-bis(diphosphate) 3'-pyrophosphohydrolase [Clostridia bacterium]